MIGKRGVSYTLTSVMVFILIIITTIVVLLFFLPNIAKARDAFGFIANPLVDLAKGTKDTLRGLFGETPKDSQEKAQEELQKIGNCGIGKDNERIKKDLSELLLVIRGADKPDVRLTASQIENEINICRSFTGETSELVKEAFNIVKKDCSREKLVSLQQEIDSHLKKNLFEPTIPEKLIKDLEALEKNEKCGENKAYIASLKTILESKQKESKEIIESNAGKSLTIIKDNYLQGVTALGKRRYTDAKNYFTAILALDVPTLGGNPSPPILLRQQKGDGTELNSEYVKVEEIIKGYFIASYFLRGVSQLGDTPSDCKAIEAAFGNILKEGDLLYAKPTPLPPDRRGQLLPQYQAVTDGKIATANALFIVGNCFQNTQNQGYYTYYNKLLSPELKDVKSIVLGPTGSIGDVVIARYQTSCRKPSLSRGSCTGTNKDGGPGLHRCVWADSGPGDYCTSCTDALLSNFQRCEAYSKDQRVWRTPQNELISINDVNFYSTCGNDPCGFAKKGFFCSSSVLDIIIGGLCVEKNQQEVDKQLEEKIKQLP